MIVREAVPFSELTTFQVGGEAHLLVECETHEDVPLAVAYAREHNLPFVMLGQGSNVLPPDEGYLGVVIRVSSKARAYRTVGDTVVVTADAGVSWDELVSEVASRDLWGIENLAGIPGTVGAAPIQNIGAYGTELQSVFVSLVAYDAHTDTERVITKREAGFGYRDSRFKHEPELIITEVTFALSKNGEPQIGYSDLRDAQTRGVDLSTPSAIGRAVREIRSTKFPDLKTHGTAGSFFKNPIVSPEQFSTLSTRYGAIPSYPVLDGVKIPLAFILDRILNLRGYRKGTVSLFGNQPLVLVADRGATTRDVDAFAKEIEEKVFTATGISIEREVRMLTARASK
ncbi:MAG: UDP-N-acetylmuramate dehydrogenase [Patescibacteria group bacterium]